MGRYGIGASPGAKSVLAGATGNQPPVYPSNGSGPPGILGAATPGISAAQGEISDLMAGRITLALVEIAFVGLIGFYLWTRSSQGG